MARKRKDEAPPGPGHNTQLTHAEQQALHFRHYRKLKEALAFKKEADDALKDVTKLIKDEGGDVKLLKFAISLEQPAGEASLKADMEAKLRIARWHGLPVGAQGDLFEAVDRTPSDEKAFAAGRLAGMKGETGSPPHDGALGQKWMEGWHAGQAEIAKFSATRLIKGDATSETFGDALEDADDQDGEGEFDDAA